MTAMPPLRNILNDTPATAIDVDWNFQTIEDYVTTDLIHKDGSVAMEAPLNLLGAPASLPTHAVPKSYVDAFLPIGMMTPFAGAAAPAGWALCDGALKSTTDPVYAALFAVIQYTYGGSGGSFNLPNMKGRAPFGLDPAAPINNNLAGAGGSRDATLVTHSHDIGHGHGHTISATSNNHDVNHQHHMDHDHGSFQTSGDGVHAHSYPVQVNNTAGSNAAQGGNNTGGVSNQATYPAEGGHFHSIDVPNLVQDTSTMINNNVHGHTISVAGGVTALAGRSDAQGVAAANANMPPYLTVNFIIRIG